MGISRSYSKLAGQWKDLMDFLQENPTLVHVVTCDDEKAAKGMRMDYYRALKVAEKDLGAAGMLMTYPNLENRMVQVRGNKVHFTFNYKSQHAIALELSLAPWKAEKEAQEKYVCMPLADQRTEDQRRTFAGEPSLRHLRKGEVPK